MHSKLPVQAPVTEKLESDPSITMSKRPALPGRYEVLELIGSGASGAVFKARDKQLERLVAIKILHLLESATDEVAKQRFLQEAKVLVSLDHPNIVKLLSSGVAEDGERYHVMEYLEGTPLSLEIGSGKRLSPERFLKVFLQLLSGLDYAHSMGVVHRDLKPSNILVCQSPVEAVKAKIIDFGIAKLDKTLDNKNDGQNGQSLTKTGSIIGSPKYMSPEQCKGAKAEQRSDIYSIACVMYEALTGNAPFEADSNVDLMYKHCSEPMPSLSRTSKIRSLSKLEKLLERCLAKESSSRPSSAGELAKELEEIFFDTKNNTDIFRAIAEQPAEKRISTVPVMLALAIMALAVSAALYCFHSEPPSDKNEIGIPQDNKESKDAKEETRLKDSINRQKRSYEQAENADDREIVREQAIKLEEAYQKLGLFYKRQQDWKAAEEAFQRGLDLAPKADRPPSCQTQVARLAELASCKYMMHDLKAADLLLQKAEKLPVGNPETKAELQSTIVALRMYQLDFDSAAKAFDLMKELHKQRRQLEINSSYVKTIVVRHKLGAPSDTARSAARMIKGFARVKFENQRQKLAAVRFLNKLAEVCVDEQTEAQKTILIAADSLLNQIAKRTDGYKEAAIQTYRLWVQYCEQSGDLRQAEKFRNEIKHLENSD